MTGGPSPVTAQVRDLYTRRRRGYAGYVQAFAHRQGIQAVLEASGLPGPDPRVLDAGCGNGLSIMAISAALAHHGLKPACLHGFDLTPAMLAAGRAALDRAGIGQAELREADVTRLGQQLPASWTGYNLIVCASMLEYVPRASLVGSLAALRARLAPGGRLFLIVTRSSFVPTRWIWKCGGYTRAQLRHALTAAGYRDIRFRRYPWKTGWLNAASHVVEASNDT